MCIRDRNDESVEGIAAVTGNDRFAWDSYRRFVQMFGNVVRGIPGERFEDAIADVVANNIVISGLTRERRGLLAHGIVGMAEATCRRWMADPGTIDHAELAAQLGELAWFGLRGIRTA